MLRSSFVSLFWAAIMEKRKRQKYPLQLLATRLGKDKSAVSRWFSDRHPNWSMDTVADIASALDLEIRISAFDRSTGMEITPSGVRQLTTTSNGEDETKTPLKSSSGTLTSYDQPQVSLA